MQIVPIIEGELGIVNPELIPQFVVDYLPDDLGVFGFAHHRIQEIHCDLNERLVGVQQKDVLVYDEIGTHIGGGSQVHLQFLE